MKYLILGLFFLAAPALASEKHCHHSESHHQHHGFHFHFRFNHKHLHHHYYHRKHEPIDLSLDNDKKPQCPVTDHWCAHE